MVLARESGSELLQKCWLTRKEQFGFRQTRSSRDSSALRSRKLSCQAFSTRRCPAKQSWIVRASLPADFQATSTGEGKPQPVKLRKAGETSLRISSGIFLAALASLTIYAGGFFFTGRALTAVVGYLHAKHANHDLFSLVRKLSCKCVEGDGKLCSGSTLQHRDQNVQAESAFFCHKEIIIGSL